METQRHMVENRLDFSGGFLLHFSLYVLPRYPAYLTYLFQYVSQDIFSHITLDNDALFIFRPCNLAMTAVSTTFIDPKAHPF